MSSTTNLVRRWHRLEIANSLAAMVVVLGAFAIAPEPAAIALVACSVLGAAMTWCLGRRTHRTGRLYRTSNNREGFPVHDDRE